MSSVGPETLTYSIQNIPKDWVRQYSSKKWVDRYKVQA